ncbi:hypothetical protein WMY93_033215 [Mugilogobius chulae]|uniref:carbonyl reductase (NADPH) n=1 Tax=Mugilogobius chulae TaxID=88201 RepID=A0AAW0MLA0_9GOBI
MALTLLGSLQMKRNMDSILSWSKNSVVSGKSCSRSVWSTTPVTAMTPKVALVTGSNKGIGLAIVRALCGQFEGDVYLTARDRARGEEAVKKLNSEGLKPNFLQLDITDVSSISRAAAFFRDTYSGLDVLINNAAIAFKEEDSTPYGVKAQVTLQTNFFGTRDMLTHFMPLIKPGGRVVNVSSLWGSVTMNKCSAELQQQFRREDITEEELVELMRGFIQSAQTGQTLEHGWPQLMHGVYGVSKTGMTTLSMIVARRTSKERPHDNILVNACCPGWVHTDLNDHTGPKTPDEGAVTPAYLALLPPGAKEPHGCLVSDKQVQPW